MYNVDMSCDVTSVFVLALCVELLLADGCELMFDIKNNVLAVNNTKILGKNSDTCEAAPVEEIIYPRIAKPKDKMKKGFVFRLIIISRRSLRLKNGCNLNIKIVSYTFP